MPKSAKFFANLYGKIDIGGGVGGVLAGGTDRAQFDRLCLTD